MQYVEISPSAHKIDDMYDWLASNTSNHYAIEVCGTFKEGGGVYFRIHFEDEEEALLFKLIWG